MTDRVFVIDALRTPIGNFGGSLKKTGAVALGTILVKEMIKRNKLEGKTIDGAIFGNVLQAGQGQNPARQIVLRAGLGHGVPATTINKVCASAMKAVDIACKEILSGSGSLYLAGGIESMSSAPYLLEDARWGHKLGDGKIIDSLVRDGLWCPISNKHMGCLVDGLAVKYNISREEQDVFSLESHAKAIKAQDEGRFSDEIIPVEVEGKKKNMIKFLDDEHPRRDTTLEALSKLRPAFSGEGTVTAGNASGINDGAALMLLASENIAGKLGLDPMAEIISTSEVGVDPKYFGLAPIDASRKALEKAGLDIDDIELAEFNEAFAAQAIAVLKELRIDKSRVNVNGGAIALGHPIGASGARIIVTLLHEMKKRDLGSGIASLCIGSGEGMAVVVKRV